MEKYTAILGFISICLTGAFAETVTVNQTVINVKPGEDVTLSCYGSSNELSYYIKNSVKWSFEHDDGIGLALTKSFFMEDAGKPDKYSLDYGEASKGYRFSIHISGIMDSDNGIYKCLLLDFNNLMVSNATVKLTVLNPVEKVTLEIHDPNSHAVLAKKTVEASENDKALKLTPGNYMVKCTATGSNPAPVMTFMYNEEKPYITLKTDKDIAGKRVRYTGSFSFHSFELKADAQDQFLTCSANIPGEEYPAKTAGIKMAITVDRPMMSCNDTSSMLGDNYAILVCEIKAPGVMCDKVKWIIATTDEIISANEQYGKEGGEYDIIESTCEGNGNKLDVELTIYRVLEAHFETIYYLSYGVGDGYRVPVELIQKPGSASLINPFSLFIYLVIAFVTRQAFQRF